MNEKLKKYAKGCWDVLFPNGWDEGTQISITHKEFLGIVADGYDLALEQKSMKARYITEFWQSLKLLQAGLDRETADYVYQRSMEVSQPGGEDGAQHYEPVYTPRPRRDGDAFTTDVIPAWSLGRIWDLFTERGWTYEFSTATPSQNIISILVDAIVVKLKQIKL